MIKRITDRKFFEDEATKVAEKLLGKIICYKNPDGTKFHFRITETEAYIEKDDRDLCHSKEELHSVGNLVFNGGMIEISCGKEYNYDNVLIRGVVSTFTCYRLSFMIARTDKSVTQEYLAKFDQIDLCDVDNDLIWLEDDGYEFQCFKDKRTISLNVKSADEASRNRDWKFLLKDPAFESNLFNNLDWRN